MSYTIHVIRKSDHQVVRKIGPYSDKRLTDRAEMGVLRNLDHEHYFTSVEEA